jgi:hypothetical protein
MPEQTHAQQQQRLAQQAFIGVARFMESYSSGIARYVQVIAPVFFPETDPELSRMDDLVRDKCD